METIIHWNGLAPIAIIFAAAFIGLLVETFIRSNTHPEPTAELRSRLHLALSLAAMALSLFSIVRLWGTEGAAFTVWGPTGQEEFLAPILIDGPGLFLQATLVVLAAVATLFIAEQRTVKGGDFVAQAAVVADSPADIEQRRLVGATEIYPLTLFALSGMMIFVVAGDLLTMFVGLEIMSIPLYLLCGLSKRRRLISQEAAFKYFLLGAFASAFFVYGMAMVYGFAGNVALPGIAGAAEVSEQPSAILYIGVAMLAVALLFKAAAVPFHMWTPDVYTGAPSAITALMASCVKVAAIGGLLRVFNMAFADSVASWHFILTVVAVATMLGGALWAVTQRNIKRLLAYSSIANAGYLLIGVIALGDAVGATMFYLVAYGFTVIAAFAVISLVRDGDNEATDLSRWAGLGKHNPLLALVVTVLMLALAGIPFTSGFTAKFGLFAAGVSAGEMTLVIVGIVSSAILAFPYLRIVVLIWLNEPAPDAPHISMPSPMAGSVVAMGVMATLLLGVAPGLLIDLADGAGQFIELARAQ
ncbi:NADH-quinone oxidoreductase subunit NuoN [Haloglycomyces albus]|uniref:NADH-quinone oxidoreductase subunit NuoN n=1 Tax=Haloglycomyces albus TaxID=526067 RepID=UPI00046D8983|nr:NADH-quinone oxidoreductase subunit NuoN [Haloglycomyces albus]